MPESVGTDANLGIQETVDRYREGIITRRDLLRALIAATGSYTAAHLFLETSGLAATLISQVESAAANVTAETIRYPSGEFQIEGYLVKPRSSGKHPAVIVIHENRGLNEHIRDVARRFAAEGFVALGPDLLSRAGGTAKMRSEREATGAIGRLPLTGVLDDLKAGFEYISKHPDVEPQRISSVGFCWGGWRSFMVATTVPQLYRAVVFYGSSPPSGYENIQAPVLAHYAQWDYQITGNSLWTADRMKQAGKKFTYYVYPESEHAFFNDTGPRHNPSAAKLAWTRTLEFLRT